MDQSIVAGAAIIGIVNGVQLLSPKIVGFYSFLLSLGLGVIFGMFHVFGLTLETGIVVALSSSGLYKVAQKMGGS